MERIAGSIRIIGNTAATYTRGTSRPPTYEGLAQQVAFTAPTPDRDWACAGEDPQMFQPRTASDLAQAKQVCASCASRVECLDIAVQRKETGVWGGVLLADGEPRVMKPRGRRKQAKEAAA